MLTLGFRCSYNVKSLFADQQCVQPEKAVKHICSASALNYFFFPSTETCSAGNCNLFFLQPPITAHCTILIGDAGGSKKSKSKVQVAARK